MEQINAIPEPNSGTIPGPARMCAATPAFSPFDHTSEQWEQWDSALSSEQTLLQTIAMLRSSFLNNRSNATYRLLLYLAAQQTLPEHINQPSMDDIVGYISTPNDTFQAVDWHGAETGMSSSMRSTIAARNRRNSAICDFTSIKEPLKTMPFVRDSSAQWTAISF